MSVAAAVDRKTLEHAGWGDNPRASEVETVADCPLCGATKRSRVRTPQRWIGDRHFKGLRGKLGLVRCRGCSLIFTDPRPSPEQLGAFYDSDAYECHETALTPAAASKAAYLLAQAERHLPANASRTLLDYGAGGGTFLLDARELGWSGWAFEPGRRGLESCREAGLPATADQGELPSGAFGLITLNHVLEHLANPLDTLSSLRPLLAPGGRLSVEVPNAGSLRARLAGLIRGERVDEAFRAFPIHLMYYTAGTLYRMLKRAGWTVEATFTMGLGLDEFYIADLKRKSAESAGESPRRARSWWRRSARDAFLSLGLGENLVAIATPSRAE